MPLLLVRDDITTMKVDAIVTAAGPSLPEGGGADSQRRSILPFLPPRREKADVCAPGQARCAPAGQPPCKTVIRTEAPRWIDGRHGEEETLRACYRSALTLALKMGCETAAFPLIVPGGSGCPRDRALHAATDAIGEFLSRADLTVYLVFSSRESFPLSQALYDRVDAWTGGRCADGDTAAMDTRWQNLSPGSRPQGKPPEAPSFPASSAAPPLPSSAAAPKRRLPRSGKARDAARPLLRETLRTAPVLPDLDRALAQLDESFSQMLLRKIDESGMTDAQFYRRANMDRKHFSKIRSSVLYRPSKPTVLASAIALELSLEETRELLMKAGFALSHSSKFDVIVEFFIRQKNYSILQINEALFAFDQPLLGG